MRQQPRGLRQKLSPLNVLIFAYILVGVGRVHQHFSFLSPLRPALLSFVLIVAYVVLNPSAIDIRNLFRTWPGQALLLLGTLAGGSALFGISLGAAAMVIIEDFASILIFACILVSAIKSVHTLRILMLAFVVSAAFWVYLSYFVLTASTQGAAQGILRLDFNYTYDPNDICVILASALPLSLIFFRTLEKRIWRLAALGVALAIPGAIAMSGSRGGLVALVAVAAALMVLVREVSLGHKLAGSFVAVLMLAAMAPPGYWDQMGTILEPTEDYNWDDPVGRRQILIRGIGYIARYPVFGLGVGNFGRAEGTIGAMAINHVPGTGLRFTAPHNTSLQIAAEMGLPALVVWLSVIGWGVFWLPRQRHRFAVNSPDPDERFVREACTYMPAAWIGFAVGSSFVSFAYLVPYYLMLAYTSGLILMIKRGPAAGTAPVAAAPRRPPEWRSMRPVPQLTGWRPQRQWSPDSRT
jgi:O-antigen ligase